MSDHDSDNSTSNGELDNESKCPQYSQMNTTLDLAPQLSERVESLNIDEYTRRSITDSDFYSQCASSRSFDVTNTNDSVNIQGTRCGVMVDSNLSGPAPKTGMLAVCSGMLPVGTGPKLQRGKLLEPPPHLTPQRFNTRSVLF